ncbi:UNKNOWN [Stylonychia lemnae]|uniref:Uncharacterized protein n=1 Tax=Stylonychia lemnae TaxID=5949 RepID=A0A078A4Q1_STYLE|nr:UNKNOWN [Stylonychia lemnae]|eukprot:CDW77147.1 UNKNOWN [Stylonychia lemnae]
MHNRFPSLNNIQNQQSSDSVQRFKSTSESKAQLKTIIPVPQDNESSFKSYTLSQTLKLRKIVQPENELEKSMSKSFIPVNPQEAKGTIMRTIQYDNLNIETSKQTILEEALNQTQQSSSSLQKNAFKRTSPSPEHIGKNQATLNGSNKFQTHLKSEIEQPRLNILHNFKEISRIMTNNFLKYKDLEKKYQKQSMPKEEMMQKRLDDDVTQKMTVIMKQMNSPRNFQSPGRRGQSQSNSLVRVVQSPLDISSTQGSKAQIYGQIRQQSSMGYSSHSPDFSNIQVKLPLLNMRFTTDKEEK